MPIITVKMAKGRTVEQKRVLVRALTKVAVETLDAREEWVTVLIEEYESDRGNWAVGGNLLVDTFGPRGDKQDVDQWTRPIDPKVRSCWHKVPALSLYRCFGSELALSTDEGLPKPLHPAVPPRAFVPLWFPGRPPASSSGTAGFSLQPSPFW